jgi:energy-coupling factor transporter ATP-binding protein EcfA2
MPPLAPATTLADAFNAFDPRTPLSGEAFKAFYVERPTGIEKFLGDLQVDANPTSKWLFTGHRGSGKSTELIRLANALSDRNFTVYYTVEDVLDMADLDYKDVLLSLGHALYAQAKARSVGLPRELLEDLVNWYSTTLKEVEGTISADAGLEERADFWFLKLTARQRSEAATREVVRRQLESRLLDLIARIDAIAKAIFEKRGQPVLAIVDGLDKVMDLAKGRRMYYEGGANLLQPRCRAIYTVPLALFYTNEFGQVRQNFNDCYFSLPNVNVNRRDGQPDPAGRRMLADLIHRRVAPGLVAPEAVERLAELSGGLLREVVALARDAISFARVRGSRQVEARDVDSAASRLRNVFAGMLTDDHYRELWRIHTDPQHRYTNSATAQQLVHNLSLLEYANGDSWWDAHPVVRPLLEERRDRLAQDLVARA